MSIHFKRKLYLLERLDENNVIVEVRYVLATPPEATWLMLEGWQVHKYDLGKRGKVQHEEDSE